MTLTWLCQYLASPPFLLPLDRIAALTPKQAFTVYLGPERDEFGRIGPPAKATVSVSPKQLFWRAGELNRLKPYQIERLWKAHNARDQ